jgi:hypothetical protein
MPDSGRALDDSAARVQVVNGIHQPGNGLDQVETEEATGLTLGAIGAQALRR